MNNDKNENKPMSFLASSAEQVLLSAHIYKCENRQTSPWLQTKMKVSYRNQNRHFMWEFFGFFFIVWWVLTCLVQKDCLELPYTMTDIWHAMYEDEAQLSYLIKKSSRTQSRCCRMDRKHRSFSLSAEFICFSNSKQWSTSLLIQLRKSWRAPNFTRFYEASKSLNKCGQ